MKWTTKGISLLRSIGVQVVIPAPKDESINKLDPNKEYTVQITKKSKKRSLDANSYCWVLCQKIAMELSKNGYISKEDVYRKAILDSQYGVPVGVKNDMVDDFMSKWSNHGIGWIVIVDDTERMQGVKRVYLYSGSSTYNTAEMARLIDCLTDECHQLGIQLEPAEYVKSLLEDWKNEQVQEGR